MHRVRSSKVLRAFVSRNRAILEDGNASQRTIRPLVVGFVPTMGALHEGHISLIERATAECDRAIVSIFVNPLQFGPHEDLDRYPRQLEQDLEICRSAGVHAVFTPDPSSLLSGQSLQEVTQAIPPAAALSQLCGPWRVGHFEGVLTIVLKLLNIVQPNRAYFGQKDAQQLALIRQMVKDFSLPIQIVGCPIVRDPDGLALSSRNQYLTPQEREVALTLSQGLFAAQKLFEKGEYRTNVLRQVAKSVYDSQLELHVQYIDVVHPDTLKPLTEISQVGLMAVAATVGTTRLIDNVRLAFSRKPILAIDGPAGAGKSTVARQLAGALDLLYLDTGALYRAVTWLALESAADISDEIAIADLAAAANIRFEPCLDSSQPAKVWVRGREVTQEIRSRSVTANVSAVSAHPMVRQILLGVQQDMGKQGGVVMEGRDIGTVVFPDAKLKIFLTASPAERARRRQLDLAAVGTSVELAQLETQIQERDRKDSQRAASPLRKAEDAVEVFTDGLNQRQVVEKIANLYRQLG
ncbi:MAG: bifunctional pantoate--beta-alanine ligase/(d)CMP kinase [Synechococcus sp.]